MDSQTKRGLLDICVLKSLMKQDSYGYRIIKDLDGIITITESTLYPILRRLELNEYLTTYSIENNGRIRKMYSITNKGIEKVKDYIKMMDDMKIIYDYIRKDN